VGKGLNAKDIHKQIKKYSVEDLTIPNNALESMWKGMIMAKYNVFFPAFVWTDLNNLLLISVRG
jgi:hypothetical protein